MQQAVAQVSRHFQEVRERFMRLNYFMKHQELPADLQETIRNYFHHFWSRKVAVDCPEVLHDLPCNLRQRVLSCTVGRVLKKVRSGMGSVVAVCIWTTLVFNELRSLAATALRRFF